MNKPIVSSYPKLIPVTTTTYRLTKEQMVEVAVKYTVDNHIAHSGDVKTEDIDVVSDDSGVIITVANNGSTGSDKQAQTIIKLREELAVALRTITGLEASKSATTKRKAPTKTKTKAKPKEEVKPTAKPKSKYLADPAFIEWDDDTGYPQVDVSVGTELITVVMRPMPITNKYGLPLDKLDGRLRFKPADDKTMRNMVDGLRDPSDGEVYHDDTKNVIPVVSPYRHIGTISAIWNDQTPKPKSARYPSLLFPLIPEEALRNKAKENHLDFEDPSDLRWVQACSKAFQNFINMYECPFDGFGNQVLEQAHVEDGHKDDIPFEAPVEAPKEKKSMFGGATKAMPKAEPKVTEKK